MVTIIYAHPWNKSFNHAILEATIANLVAKQQPYNVIDLYKDGFNPLLTEAELALYSKGEHLDPLITQYQGYLKKSTSLIVIFPIWWGSYPAMIKGFLDKVMSHGFAYEVSAMSIKGLLTNMTQATVITTANTPRFVSRLFLGNPILGSFKLILKQVGIKKVTWLSFAKIKRSTEEERKVFLSKVTQYRSF